MHHAQAHALRRAAVALAVILATLAAHVAGMGWHGLTPRAPFMAGFAVAAASLIGRRDHPFRARGVPATLLSLVLLQAAAHAVLATAPWVMGLSMHHAVGMPSTAMLVAHLVAAVALTGVLRHLDTALERATTIVRAVRRLLAAARPAAQRRDERLQSAPLCVPRSRPGRTAPSRGPPSAASA